MKDEVRQLMTQTFAIICGLDATKTALLAHKNVAFKADVDFEKFSRGKVYPYDTDIVFVVVPSLSWNDMQNELQKASLNEHQRHRLTIGRAFRISLDNTILKVVNNQIRVALLLNPDYDQTKYDLVDTIRWGNDVVDTSIYPFVLVTLHCWNNFQHLLDEYELRDKMRAFRPMAVPVTKKGVFKTTLEDFAKIRNKKSKATK